MGNVGLYFIFATALAATDPASQGGSSPPPATPSANTTTTAAADPDKTICRTEEVTGSRFKQRVCMRRSEWKAREDAAAEFMRQSNSNGSKMGAMVNNR